MEMLLERGVGGRGAERVRVCQSDCASHHRTVPCGPDYVQVPWERQFSVCQSGVLVFVSLKWCVYVYVCVYPE
jgi:hypothetical protein